MPTAEAPSVLDEKTAHRAGQEYIKKGGKWIPAPKKGPSWAKPKKKADKMVYADADGTKHVYVKQGDKWVYKGPLKESSFQEGDLVMFTEAKELSPEELTPKSLLNYLKNNPGETVDVGSLAYAFNLRSQKVTSMIRKMVKDGQLEVKKKSRFGWTYGLAEDIEGADECNLTEQGRRIAGFMPLHRGLNEKDRDNQTEPYKLGQLRKGQRIYPTGSWWVHKATPKTVTIFMRTEVDLGPRFAGRSYTYKWDGVGFKRQGQYLRPDGVY